MQIHDYRVAYSKDVIDDGITIWIEYDYSAQNSFGGYNRDNVTVTCYIILKLINFHLLALNKLKFTQN